MFDSIRVADRREHLMEARRESPVGAPDHSRRKADLAALAAQAELAEPVARRFFSAFSLYELGELDGRVKAKLRVTASAPFARELIAAPPRTPGGAERPARARLGALEFVAGEVDPRRERLSGAELVGDVRRSGERSAIAIELVRERQDWRVGGLGP